MSYSTATTYLEHATTTQAITYTVPSTCPVSDEPQPDPVLAQPDHALSSSTFFPPQSTGFVLSRIIEDGYTLELRWVGFSNQSGNSGEGGGHRFQELDQQGTLPPVRFVFPSRLVPAPYFALAEESGALQVYALTEAGFLYSLAFTAETLFYSTSLGEEQWSEEYELGSLVPRLPVLMHGVAERRVIVACADGYNSSFEIDADHNVVETELRSAHSFSVRSLLPSFSSRNLSSFNSSSSSPSTSSPFQLLSLASSSPEGLIPFAFGVTRDRKLKIWNLGSGVCLKSIDLPRPSATPTTELDLSRNNKETDSPGGNGAGRNANKGSTLLPSSPQPLAKIVHGDSTSSYPSYLLLFVPAVSGNLSTFFIYGIQTDDEGVVNELTPIGERVCASSAAMLVDFEASTLGPKGNAGSHASQSGNWTLWTLWQEGGETEIRLVDLPELKGQGGMNVSEEDDVEPSWTVVAQGTAGVSTWNAGHFDELFSDTSKGVTEVFIEHIFYPGRYPSATFEHALSLYEESLLNEFDHHQRIDALSLDYDSLNERICAIVGCTVQLETSPTTGAYLYDAYNKRLKIEWLRFVAMCNESVAEALFPTLLAVCPERLLVLCVSRDAVSVPIVQDTVLMMQQLVSNDASSANIQTFLTGSPDVVGSTYPHLAERGIRHDVVTLFRVISDLTNGLSLDVAGRLEVELLARARAPFTLSTEETAVDIYERMLESYIDDDLQGRISDQLRLLSTPEASFVALWTLLTTAELVQPLPSSSPFSSDPISDLSSALLTNSLAESIEARYSVALGLVTLLLYVYSEEEHLVPHIASLTSGSFATLHTLSSLRWLIQQAATPLSVPVPASEDAILARFGEMNVSSNRFPSQSEDSVQSFSLLNGLLRFHYSPTISSSYPLVRSLTGAMSNFLNSTGLIIQKRLLVDSPADVLFGLRLRQIGLSELALEFVNMYPRGPGMLFVLGLAYLDLGRTDEAQAAFAKAAPALYSNIRLDDGSGISNVLPVDVGGSLARYYRHVVTLFVEHSVELAVIKFASLAIAAYADEGILDDVVTRDLWLKLFKSNASLGLYEDAHNTLMEISHAETKSTCLAHLISVLCENGQIDLLTQYPFVGLQSELERNLAFRARNSDPTALPNYYQILYAYHIAKGDYRSAGATMFQQGRRLGELSGRGGNFKELATRQCQSYLAAANALSLIDPKNAWVAIPADEHAVERGSKRRKITYHIPEEEFDNSTRAAEIVELSDIRREYTLALSRLQLSVDFPELERTNFSLDPEAAVALFSQIGAFGSAFTTARTLNVDMSSLFQIVTEKCVGLALHGLSSDDASWVALNDDAATWEGSLAAKAWRLLKTHLDRHDDDTFKYHIVVLERLLSVNQEGKIPAWLIDSFLAYDSTLLIRTLFKYDRLGDAFDTSVAVLATSKPSAACASSSLPISLFDQLLTVTAGDSPALTSEELHTRQISLRKALESHYVTLEKMGTALLRAGR